MKAPDAGAWRRTSPLAILFFLGRLLRDLVKNAWQSLAPLAAFVYAAGGSIVDRLIIGTILFGVVIVAAAALRYWFFRFQLIDDSILIRQGVIKKKQLDIKFDRIQGINTQQNVVFRYFGLVTVTFDTAGSSGDEGNLPAVPRAFADALRERIGKRRVTIDDDGADIETASDALLQLDWRDMIRIGLSDKRVLLVLAFLGPILERIGDDADNVVAGYVEGAAESAMQFGLATAVILFFAVLISVAVLLGLISVGAAFLRYHNFELSLDGSTLRSRGGLLTTHEVSIDLSKIQTLRLQQGIILRWFRRFKMTARQARSSQKNDSNKNFTIPVVTADLATMLRRRFLAQEGRGLTQIPVSDKFIRISPYYMRVPVLLGVLVPLAITAALYAVAQDRATLLILLSIPLTTAFIYLNWRHAGYLYTDDGFVRRSGTIGYRTVALLYRKVQRVSVSQSRLQRRKGLATLRVYMASGSVRIPYIEHGLAKGLRDYILYKVESSQQAWH